MLLKGKISQLSIFGQLEFIKGNKYTPTVSKKNTILLSGIYKIVGTEDTVDTSLEFEEKIILFNHLDKP